MIDKNKKIAKDKAKEKERRRIHVDVDPDNYDYIPEVKQADYYDNDIAQRVAICVRVSTDDIRQTTSFELQKKYYEDFVVKHPHWTLVKIYADEGISGTSLNKREQFLEMIADAKHPRVFIPLPRKNRIPKKRLVLRWNPAILICAVLRSPEESSLTILESPTPLFIIKLLSSVPLVSVNLAIRITLKS